MRDDTLYCRVVEDIYASVLIPERRARVRETIHTRLGSQAALWRAPDCRASEESFIGLCGLDPEVLIPWADDHARRAARHPPAYRAAASAAATSTRGSAHGPVCRPPAAEALDRGSLAFIERLLPHLRHASALYERLGMLWLTDAIADHVIDETARAVFVVDGARRVVRLNAAAETLAGRDDGVSLREGCLEVRGASKARRLDALIALVAGGQRADDAPLANDMVVPRTSMCALPYVLTVSALIGHDDAAAFGRERRRVMVAVHEPTGVPRETWVRVSRLYGLTAQETRVAMRMCDGEALPDVANALGITVNTCRTHIKALFNKTGTGRQAELVATLLKFK